MAPYQFENSKQNDEGTLVPPKSRARGADENKRNRTALGTGCTERARVFRSNTIHSCTWNGAFPETENSACRIIQIDKFSSQSFRVHFVRNSDKKVTNVPRCYSYKAFYTDAVQVAARCSSHHPKFTLPQVYFACQ